MRLWFIAVAVALSAALPHLAVAQQPVAAESACCSQTLVCVTCPHNRLVAEEQARADYVEHMVKCCGVPEAVVESKENMPIFLTVKEVSETPSWNDWARVHGGVLFVPGTGTEAFWLLEVLTGGLRHRVIVACDDGKFNVTREPVMMTLTRPMRVNHWGEVAGPAPFGRGRLHVALGISANQLKQENQEEDVEPMSDDVTSRAYFIGLAESLNPYVNLNAGFTVQPNDSELKWQGSYGFSLDLAIIGQMFK